ncbi:hypothetical protein MLC52_10900 [Sulfurimonas sp. NW15]|uniref:hypothetical protein n=1 Tax=Sulfurimonas sp. NW15 TaxID=2922729 RepID=UPI003DA91CA6
MKFKDSKDLIKKTEYQSMVRIRDMILNIFNPLKFTNVDLQGIIRNSDKEHLELFEDIIDMSKGDGYFEIVMFGEQLEKELYENR